MDAPRWTQAPLFTALKPAQVERLQAMAVTKRLDAGQLLFLEGEPCTGFYILLEGAVQLTRAGAPGAHPTLATILPVQSFAEAAMFANEAFPATATALQATRLAHFPKHLFLGALRSDPELALAVIQAQAAWLRRLTLLVERLGASDSLERLRQWLQEQVPLGSVYKLPITKKALSAQLGMAPETLSRALRALQEDGILEVRGQSFRRLRGD